MVPATGMFLGLYANYSKPILWLLTFRHIFIDNDYASLEFSHW